MAQPLTREQARARFIEVASRECADLDADSAGEWALLALMTGFISASVPANSVEQLNARLAPLMNLIKAVEKSQSAEQAK